ncbi:MAG: flippase [bacterium]
MKYYLKNLSRIKTRRVLLENIGALGAIQIMNYVLPLITFPYLVRVLGPEKYGLVSFALSFVTYFMIFVDYGFEYSATREVSLSRNNKDRLSEIFSSVMLSKILLIFLSLLLMSVIVFSFERFRQDWFLYFMTFSMVIGYASIPSWFFQGVENMKFITISYFVGRLIFVINVFVFIKSQSDYYLVHFLNSVGLLMCGVILIISALTFYGVRLFIPSRYQIIQQIEKGRDFFILSSLTQAYSVSNTLILGLISGETYVGYYYAAEKIVNMVLSLLSFPITRAFFPYMSRVAKESKERGLKIVRKLSVLVGSIAFFISAILFISADLIVKILLGDGYSSSINILRFLSFLVFIKGLSGVFITQGLLAFGLKHIVVRIMLIVNISHIILAVTFTKFFSIFGSVISLCITETLLAFLSIKSFMRIASLPFPNERKKSFS